MRKTIAVAVLPLLLAGLMTSEALADERASTTITIQVMPIDLIGVDPTEPMNPGQTGETDLKWSTNTADSRKVFVRVDHVPVGLKSFKVEALTAGAWGEHSQPPVGVGEVTLNSTEQHELISAIWAGGGGCKIRYTAEVVDAVEQGASDVVEVSYILTTSNGSPLSVSTHQLVIGQGLPLSQGENAVQNGEEVYYITITDTE